MYVYVHTHTHRNKKILEGSKKLFRVIISKQAYVKESYFSLYTLWDCLKFFLSSAYIIFSVNKVIHKAKFQNRPVINYLALHKKPVVLNTEICLNSSTNQK